LKGVNGDLMRDVRLWPVRKVSGVIEVDASLEGGGYG
jgi:hypothetical protein